MGENDFHLAQCHFQRATELAAEHDVELMAQALSALASLDVLSGDTAGGLLLATDAIASAERSPLRMVLVMALMRAGEAALLDHRHENAHLIEVKRIHRHPFVYRHDANRYLFYRIFACRV